jgi:hypothetical protein
MSIDIDPFNADTDIDYETPLIRRESEPLPAQSLESVLEAGKSWRSKCMHLTAENSFLSSATPEIAAAWDNRESAYQQGFDNGQYFSKQRIAAIETALRACIARAGAPDPSEACRQVIATAQDALTRNAP